MKRRNFLASMGMLLGLGVNVKTSHLSTSEHRVPRWTLDDLQYGVDYLYQMDGMLVDTIVCSHADRRHILMQARTTNAVIESVTINYSIKVNDVVIRAERMPEGYFFLLDTKHGMHPLTRYHAATRTFDI